MYVALNQLNSPHTSVPGTGAEVAIIDLKTKKTEVIKDNRTSVVGLFRHSDAFIDERGDIYFYSAGNNFNVADKEGSCVSAKEATNGIAIICSTYRRQP